MPQFSRHATPHPHPLPASTALRVFSYDPTKPIAPGMNPVQIATSSIPFQARLPRREAKALEEVHRLCPNRGPFELSHATDGSVVATSVTKPHK